MNARDGDEDSGSERGTKVGSDEKANDNGREGHTAIPAGSFACFYSPSYTFHHSNISLARTYGDNQHQSAYFCVLFSV